MTRRPARRRPVPIERAPWWLLPAATIAGIAVIWAGNLFGLWWLATALGVALGLSLPRAGAAIAAAAIAGVLGWGLPLLQQSLSVPIGRTASVVAGIMGFGAGNGAIVVAVTLLLAVLLAVTGAWVGSAARRLAGLRA
jgi:hypothetical protein